MLKSQCGPLILAIKALNVKAVKDMLEADSSMNLRESLRGPVEKNNLEGGIWNYEFVKDDLSMPF